MIQGSEIDMIYPTDDTLSDETIALLPNLLAQMIHLEGATANMVGYDKNRNVGYHLHVAMLVEAGCVIVQEIREDDVITGFFLVPEPLEV